MHPMHWLLTAVYKNAEEDISSTAIWRERAAHHCGRQTPVVAELSAASVLTRLETCNIQRLVYTQGNWSKLGARTRRHCHAGS